MKQINTDGKLKHIGNGLFIYEFNNDVGYISQTGYSMVTDINGFNLVGVGQAIRYLNMCEKSRTIVIDKTSYTFKHYAEQWFKKIGEPCYISNGQMITAFIIMGFKTYVDIGSPNTYHNLSVQHKIGIY